MTIGEVGAMKGTPRGTVGTGAIVGAKDGIAVGTGAAAAAKPGMTGSAKPVIGIATPGATGTPTKDKNEG